MPEPTVRAVSDPPPPQAALYPTKVVNIIGGPGCGKSLFSATIMLHLHQHHKTVEQLPDHARLLVWRGDHDALRNQYQIALQQFRLLELLDGKVQYLVSECSLPQLLYYNAHYAGNVCDVARTRAQILHWHGRHETINVLVERGDGAYLRAGRLQDEEGARAVDRELRVLLDREHIAHTIVRADLDAIRAFADSLM
ncbi:MAG: hypothetical protein KDH93_27115 [Rhodoferax sp.]|nr:hypothetical protein [Rhodoferax sp.]